MKKILTFFFIVSFLFGYKITKPTNFETAKEYSTRLYGDYYHYTFYTHTEMTDYVKIKHTPFPKKPIFDYTLILLKYPYKGSKYVKRGKNIEWEHIVPVQWMITADPKFKDIWENGDDKCVTKSGKKYKGRKCLEKVSPKFRLIESDMFNLVPVIGALNGLRSDKPYCIIPDEKREFGESIDFEVNKSCVEVMPSIRGDVSRIVLYMVKTYGIKISDDEMKLMQKWKQEYNASDWLLKKKQILEEKLDYNITY